ncbi:MAG: DNA-3-methyladenine glycosylase I [Candidatus Bathyarchaeota archaeon]|nr:DNA-3-methyladenine glycosylase I [Candidatus Bathyarchaeota archaeon]
MSAQRSPPEWIYSDSRPDDRGYFENMTRIIFQGGLNWELIEKKWPSFRKALRNFSIPEVAGFGDKEVEKLMQDSGIVRNRAKIVATINNAKQFQIILKKYGTFRRYIDSLDKTENYAHVVKELAERFSRLGPSSARIFLYSVGEEIRHEM